MCDGNIAPGNGLPFDVRPFYDASLNYYLRVTLVEDQLNHIRPWAVEPLLSPTAGMTPPHTSTGHDFISGTTPSIVRKYLCLMPCRVHLGRSAECARQCPDF